MAFVWKPAIYKDSTLTQLPRPISRVRLNLDWDRRESKVPLLDGLSTTGHSKNGRIITISGQFGWNADGPLCDEGDSLDEAEVLIGLLDIATDSEKFELFLYHDASSAVYRKFKQCSPVSFGDAHGDTQEERVAGPYELVILAEDPVLYTTAPGS